MKKLFYFLLIPTTLFASIKSEVKNDPTKFPKLSLQQVNYLTDERGVFIPNLIENIRPGHTVSFKLSDGTVIVGLIKEQEVIDKKIIKIFGESLNKQNCGFGFVWKMDEIFAGALVFRDQNKTYTIKFNDAFKGYVLEFTPEKLKIQ